MSFKYDVTLPDLAGFRIYSYSDRKLILDSAVYSSYCNLNDYKSQNQPATITIAVPLSEITTENLRKGMSLSITAYVKNIDNTEVESAFSAPVTIQ